MTIAAKTGDSGETSLATGERVAKNSFRIEACGAVDELNSVIGVALNYVKNESAKEVLSKVQNNLFLVGAELGCETAKGKIEEHHVSELDDILEEIESGLPRLTGFILPRGTKGSCFLHQARAVCRRAEIRIVAIENIRPQTVKYLNRLSDVIFTLARLENTEQSE